MIPQRSISLLSNRLANKGGRRIREDVLERDYCLAWFLAVLSRSDLKPVLGFMGGTALKRCYFSEYRFSEDLDFTLLEPIPMEEILRRLDVVYKGVRDESGITFAFAREDRQKHVNSYTFYLRYTRPLPTDSDAKVDITVREHMVLPLADRPILRGYPEFAAVPEERLMQVYSLEEIATEKVLALVDGARNEARDLYDLWYLTYNRGIHPDHLTDAICQKLNFRGKPCKDLEVAILQKEARLKVLRSRRLAYQMPILPEFEEVFRAIRRTLRQVRRP